jgi:hypothetical protein
MRSEVRGERERMSEPGGVLERKKKVGGSKEGKRDIHTEIMSLELSGTATKEQRHVINDDTRKAVINIR